MLYLSYLIAGSRVVTNLLEKYKIYYKNVITNF